MIFFGTGDREHPNSTNVVNRIYAIKNEWTNPAPATLTESDLIDVTSDLIQMGTAEEKEATREGLENSKGWYFQLENLGEQITSSVTVYAGVAYFTTYTPEAGAVVTDPCEAASGRGQARLYAVNYLTGGAVHDFSTTSETDASGNVVERGKMDRSKLIGTSMPSAPVIAVLPGKAVLFVGVEGGVAQHDPDPVADLHLFYWRQITN
jgi:type IV pilus assembly protein PilY1